MKKLFFFLLALGQLWANGSSVPTRLGMPIRSGRPSIIMTGCADADVNALGSSISLFSAKDENGKLRLAPFLFHWAVSRFDLASGFTIDGSNNVTSVGNLAGTLTTAAQPNITSIGAQSTVDITGGTISGITQLDVDNIRVDGNSITSTDVDGAINITPNGDGVVVLDGLNWPIADGTNGSTLQTNGAGDLSFAAGAFVSSFGDQYVSDRSDQVNLLFQYNVPSDLIQEETANGGTVTQTTGYLSLKTSTDASGSVSVRSNDVLHYQPGHEGTVYITAGFIAGGVANSTQWIGLLTAENGWAIGYNGTDFSILHRNDSSDSTVAQASFNGDKINGTGASGFNIDPTQINLFRIAYGWLGVAPIKFQVCTSEGEWVTFHTIEYPNTAQIPTVVNPTLPVNAQIIKSSADGTDMEMRTCCWAASVVGEVSGQRQFTTITTAKTVTTTETPIFSLRNMTQFSGEMNLTTLQGILLSLSVETDKLVRFKVRKNGVLTSASWSDFDAGVSVMEIDTSASAIDIVGPPVPTIVLSTMASRDSATNFFLKSKDFKIIVQPGDWITFTGQTQSATADADTSFTWDEIT